jgi:hypothetical protein
MRRAALLATLCSLLLAIPAAAETPPDPLASGATTITLAPSFERLLSAHGVRLSPGAPAIRKGAAYCLPLAQGAVNPTLSQLSFEAGGNLVFSRGRRRVVLRHLSAKDAQIPLIAKVGGGQLKIASSPRRRFARSGFDSIFTASGLRLTEKVATRLSKKLRLRGVFREGQLLGALRAKAVPQTVAVQPSARLDLDLDPAFVAKLDGLFVSLNPVAPAERISSTRFTVPFIPAGTIAPDGQSGVPRTGGSLEFLLLGSGQVFWHELWFDLGAHQALAEADLEPTPTYPGKLGQQPIAELGTTVANVASDPRTRTVRLSNAPLALSPTGAAELNQALAGGKPTFSSGEALGSASFVAATR